MVKNYLLIVLTWAGSLVYSQKVDYEEAVGKYILRFKDVAVREMLIYRIPASITLAQGIIESDAGRSDLAVKANNHFGIKCHKEWTGKTFIKDDDAKDECFRKYDDPVESYRDHSYFLTTRDRYKGLFRLDITDYKGWAHGLKQAGYATNPQYPVLLIRTIERFVLDRYDHPVQEIAASDSLVLPGIAGWPGQLKRFEVVKKAPGNRSVYTNNGLELILAGQDDNIYLIARDLKVSVNRLLKYNDLPKATSLKPGQIVYLGKKRRKAAVEFHLVRQGETMYDLSQLYGIRLKMLYKRNDLREGVEPDAGTVLQLR